MQRRARFHRIRLVAYELIDLPLLSLPPRVPSSMPLSPRLRVRVFALRKIHLVRLPSSENTQLLI